MSQNSVSEVILKFSLDEQAQRRVLKGVGDVEQILSQTRKRIVSVEDAAAGLNSEFAELARAKAIENLSADAIRAASETDDWAAALKRVSTELSAIGASDSEIKQVARSLATAQSSTRGGRAGGGNIETVDRLGSVGSQVLSGLGQGELANVAGLVGDVAGSIGSLGVAGIAGAAALGAVSIAMSEYNRQIEVQRAALSSAFEAQDRYIEALKNFNSEQARAALETENENRRFLVIEANNTQALIWEAWDQAVATFGDAGARSLQALGQLPTNALQTRLDELNGQIGESEGYLIRLRNGLEAGAFATNDAAEAEARLAAERDKLAQITTSAAIRADQLTAEQRAKRIDEINREIELLGIFGTTSAETQTQIANLTAEADGLRMVFNSTADAAAELAARTAAIDQQSDNYLDAVTDTVKAEEELFKARQESQSVYDKYIADSLRISQEAEARYQEIVAESGDKRISIVEKTEKQIQKIQRDSGRELFNAVAERDTLALHLAAQKNDEQLKDAQDAQSDQLKEFEKGQEKQFKALQTSVSKQVSALDASYRSQAQILANAEMRKQIDLQNSKASEVAIAANGANGLRSIMSNMWGQLTMEAVNGVTAILTQTRQLVGGMGGTQMYVNGVNAGSPAAYDLVGLPPPQTTAINRVVDTRLNTYFRTAGITER